MRLVRERVTQQGKGFGYIGFVDAGSVERALGLHGTKIATAPTDDGKATGGRELRVFRCSTSKSNARHSQQVGEGRGAPREARGRRRWRGAPPPLPCPLPDS